MAAACDLSSDQLAIKRLGGGKFYIQNLYEEADLVGFTEAANYLLALLGSVHGGPICVPAIANSAASPHGQHGCRQLPGTP